MNKTQTKKLIKRSRSQTFSDVGDTYKVVKNTIGKGVFGKVHKCVNEQGKLVAIKTAKYDEKCPSKEFEILKMLSHPNCIKVFDRYFNESKGKKKELMENIVMEYVDLNLYDFIKSYNSASKRIPIFYVKLFAYQLFAGLAYLNSKFIVHRDIKPENLLINTANGSLKICDFGNSKIITPNMESTTYVASRFYRAPELLLGCKKYNGEIDVWSAGCVLAEMIIGKPIFMGKNNEEMIQKIESVLGNPSTNDFHSCAVPLSPNAKSTSLDSVLPANTPLDLKDLLKRIFVYNPAKRITAKECTKHKFFKELFVKGMTMPSGAPLPLLIV